MDGSPVAGAIEGAGWTPTPDPAVRTSIVEMEESGGELDMTVDTGDSVGMARITAGGITRARPALAGPKVQDRAITKLDEGYGLIPVDRVGEIEGMPFTGPSGLLVDYSSFITDRPVYDNLVTVHVLAREGTPASITEALSEAGLSVGTTLAQERHVLDQSAYALALRLYGVVAALVLLMALAGLFVSAAVQLPARRRDAAALRVVGVPKSSRHGRGGARAGRRAGQRGAGRHPRGLARAVGGAAHHHARATPTTRPRRRWWRRSHPYDCVVLALLAAAVFGAVALVSASMTVRGARGATLRESAR